MSDRLNGKVAIVTGAGQGIGRGIARAFATEGAQLVLAGRTGAKLDAVADEIADEIADDTGAKVVCVACDLAERSGTARMVDTAIAAFGAVDVLVNNAQDSVQRPLEETSDDDVALAYRTGPLATLYAMQACFPHLKDRGGSIVNFGSSTALVGSESFGSYAMAKEAIRGLSRVAAREWGPYGIRVNVVCPAALSPSAEAWAERHPERFASVLRNIPLGRMGDAELDIGRAVAALASDDLRYLTGATLVLEGGRVIYG